MSRKRDNQQGGHPMRRDQAQQGGGANPSQQQQQNPDPDRKVNDMDEEKESSRNIGGPTK